VPFGSSPPAGRIRSRDHVRQTAMVRAQDVWVGAAPCYLAGLDLYGRLGECDCRPFIALMTRQQPVEALIWGGVACSTLVYDVYLILQQLRGGPAKKDQPARPPPSRRTTSLHWRRQRTGRHTEFPVATQGVVP